jgi:hypothetical protein
LATTAAYQLRRTKGRYALCTMCIGVGQGIAMILERSLRKAFSHEEREGHEGDRWAGRKSVLNFVRFECFV